LYAAGVQTSRLARVWGSCSISAEFQFLLQSRGPLGFAVPRVTLRVISVISIATALVCVSFLSQPDSELQVELTMPSVTRWVCMGCQQPNRHCAPGPGSYFAADYKSAACHYARSAACNKSNRGLRTVTVVSRPSDRDVGGGGGAGAWPPRKGAI